jgi:hypothetical protein
MPNVRTVSVLVIILVTRFSVIGAALIMTGSIATSSLLLLSCCRVAHEVVSMSP